MGSGAAVGLPGPPELWLVVLLLLLLKPSPRRWRSAASRRVPQVAAIGHKAESVTAEPRCKSAMLSVVTKQRLKDDNLANLPSLLNGCVAGQNRLGKWSIGTPDDTLEK